MNGCEKMDGIERLFDNLTEKLDNLSEFYPDDYNRKSALAHKTLGLDKSGKLLKSLLNFLDQIDPKKEHPKISKKLDEYTELIFKKTNIITQAGFWFDEICKIDKNLADFDKNNTKNRDIQLLRGFNQGLKTIKLAFFDKNLVSAKKIVNLAENKFHFSSNVLTKLDFYTNLDCRVDTNYTSLLEEFENNLEIFKNGIKKN